MLVCEKLAENPEFRVGNFTVNLKREIYVCGREVVCMSLFQAEINHWVLTRYHSALLFFAVSSKRGLSRDRLRVWQGLPLIIDASAEQHSGS